MAELTLTKTRIRGGLWEGLLAVKGEEFYTPDLTVTLQDKPVEGVKVIPHGEVPGSWMVTVPIPASSLSDGIQTFLFVENNEQQTLGSFTIVTGEPLSDDIAAEVDLLRAELDMLKRAFRRHCVETSG